MSSNLFDLLAGGNFDLTVVGSLCTEDLKFDQFPISDLDSTSPSFDDPFSLSVDCNGCDEYCFPMTMISNGCDGYCSPMTMNSNGGDDSL